MTTFLAGLAIAAILGGLVGAFYGALMFVAAVLRLPWLISPSRGRRKYD